MKKIFKNILKNNEYIVYDNIINREMSNKILNTLMDSNFPWFLSSSVYTADEESIKEASNDYTNLKEYLQFVHTFYDNLHGDTQLNSSFAYLADAVLQEYMNYILIDTIKLKRCKANFQTQHSKNNLSLHNTPHIDLVEPHLVLLYYANDSDGDTVLFKDEKEYVRISPKQGRILLFNGDILHTGSHPCVAEYRIVINYNITSA
jgi:phosphomannomutase